MRGAVLVFTLVLAAAIPAAAQVSVPADPPRFTIGVSGGALGGYIDLSDLKGDAQMGSLAAGALAGVRLSRRIELEGGIQLLMISGVSVQSFDVGVVVRQKKNAARFVRLGVGWHLESEAVPEFRQTNEDLSVTVFPGYTQ